MPCQVAIDIVGYRINAFGIVQIVGVRFLDVTGKLEHLVDVLFIIPLE